MWRKSTNTDEDTAEKHNTLDCIRDDLAYRPTHCKRDVMVSENAPAVNQRPEENLYMLTDVSQDGDLQKELQW